MQSTNRRAFMLSTCRSPWRRASGQRHSRHARKRPVIFEQPLRIVVPRAWRRQRSAGRSLAVGMSRTLGQPVIVGNKPGGLRHHRGPERARVATRRLHALPGHHLDIQLPALMPTYR